MGRQDRDWRATQRAYYEAGHHAHLDVAAGGRFADGLVRRTFGLLGVGSDAEGAEIGCGAGRFTLPLLRRCRRLLALDLSARQLARLADALAAEPDLRARCVPVQRAAEEADDVIGSCSLDFVIGHFVLHHLEDPVAVLRRARGWLRPGGRMVFLEPNRLNPLYLAQIACCADMRWAEERALYQRGAAGWRSTLEAAGLEGAAVEHAGFFPPQVLNRVPAAARLEARIESWRWLRPALPFLLLHGTAPAGAGAGSAPGPATPPRP